MVTANIALGATFSISAWVNPAVIPEGSYVRIAETQFGSGLFLGTNSTGGKYKFIVNANVPGPGRVGPAPMDVRKAGTVFERLASGYSDVRWLIGEVVRVDEVRWSEATRSALPSITFLSTSANTTVAATGGMVGSMMFDCITAYSHSLRRLGDFQLQRGRPGHDPSIHTG